MAYRFNRLEVAGSLGDLGTLLPLALGMIVINGLDPVGTFFTIGLYYILSGAYFGVTVPVQPMKVIGAYAVATAISADQIMASALLMGIVLIVLGATDLITFIARFVPKAVVRGVQLSTGALLMSKGVRFMLGTSTFQVLQDAAEPFLRVQSIGPIPLGVVIGVLGGLITLLLLDSRKLPAGLIVVVGGGLLGLVLGDDPALSQVRIGWNLPHFLPFGIPGHLDLTFAFLILVLPQVPMTLGNAVFAYADLSRDYFGDDSKRVSYRAATISMGLANFLAFATGGIPLCHGAGGLAAHYRFGARTAGSNMVIGGLFLALAVLLGSHALAVVHLLPMAVLGVLLLFAGVQLALTIIDLTGRKELFVTLVMLGITLASNLAVGFFVGIALARLLNSDRMNV